MIVPREIAFRGKRIDNGEWVEGYLIGNDVIVGEIVEWDDEYFCTEFWLKVDPETVGQFSGVNDILSADIWEGDIIEIGTQSPPYYEIVEYGGGSFRTKEGDELISYLEDEHSGEGCKVVGNIFDHGFDLYGVHLKHLLPKEEEPV